MKSLPRFFTMLTCSTGNVSNALLRQHMVLMSSSSKKRSPLLLFSLRKCVHNNKLTTFQQCFLSTGTSALSSSLLGRFGYSLPPRRDYHCCSLNLNNHHISFHYIKSSIVTSSILTTTDTTTTHYYNRHHHQTRSFIRHQSSSAPPPPPPSSSSSSPQPPLAEANSSKIVTNNSSTANTTTNEHWPLFEENKGVISQDGDGDQEEVAEGENDAEKLALEEMLKEQVWSKGPAITPTFNVGAYANDSENVKKLLQLGVNLSKWEPRYGTIPLLYKSNFETTMQPIIHYLMDLGVEGPDLSRVLTVNPFIFNEQVENLKKRVEYLRVKKFEEEAILNIIARNPYMLSFSVPRIDRRLGFFQTYFGLTGDQVRTLASVGSSGPKLITYHLGRVKDVTFTIKEEMGFTSREIVKLLLTRPRIWKEVPASLRLRFDYAHNEEKFSHADFVRWPMLLLTRERRLRERIGFLKKLGRAQFDPRQPNYISPERLCVGNDAEWATDVARVAVAEYNNYLKTL